MERKRVVITGMGVVSCFGNDVGGFYQNLLDGNSGATLITEFPVQDFPTKFAAVIRDFDVGDYMDKKQARRVDKFISYAMMAGKKALEMSGLTGAAFDKLDKTVCGVIIGSGMGGMSIYADGVETLLQKGPRRVTPFFVPYILTNMAGGLLGIDLGFMGPNYSISTACATSNHSIIAAANHIRAGDADVMVCGGVEAPIIPIGLAGFCACKALSTRNEEPTEASRPWDKGRDGFVMGEGAGVLVLESLEHAVARGATILAEYLGGGISTDAHHMTEPRPDGAGVAICIRNALHNAGIEAREINYINAHATSTPAGDMAEIEALKKVFTQERASIAINATKSMIGHGLGAAGGLEAIATVKSILAGMIHPTINLADPEPGIDFHVPLKAEKWDTRIALSNSFGFGGHNASIVIGKYTL